MAKKLRKVGHDTQYKYYFLKKTYFTKGFLKTDLGNFIKVSPSKNWPHAWEC
jgi:hypothetical protein